MSNDKARLAEGHPLPTAAPTPVPDVREAVELTCCCGHRVKWHHDTRGCGYYGFSDTRCPCPHDIDRAVLAIPAIATALGLSDE